MPALSNLETLSSITSVDKYRIDISNEYWWVEIDGLCLNIFDIYGFHVHVNTGKDNRCCRILKYEVAMTKII